MERHSKANNVLSRLSELSTSRRQAYRQKRTPIRLTLLSLTVISSLFLALLPAATANQSVAIAKKETPDFSTPQNVQPTVQIEQEMATIRNPLGAVARVQPSADAEVLTALADGETFKVTGRSYDDDAGAEWVSVQVSEDENVWVSSASIESTTELAAAPARTSVPTADILNTDEELVYIDSIGRIKVFDVEQAGDIRVTWESPETGFVDLALGDFNDDGDDEIVAIRGIGAAGELIVYDPVLNSTTIPAVNAGTAEIPWAELYRQTIGFTPTVVGTGELDQGIPGDEILFGYETGATTSEIVVIKGNSLTPDGTGWLKHIPSDTRRGVVFPHIWETVSIDNLNNSGTDEVVLTTSSFAPKSYLQIYRLDNSGLDVGVSAVDINSSKLSWRGTTTGNVRDDATPELITFRKATGNSVGSATVFISRFAGSSLEEEEGDAEVFNPQPKDAFTADINGNGDEEIFFLRNVSGNDAGIRLIARNRGTDTIDSDKTELSLDADNRWNVGVGVDVDGNNIDEIALMQTNGIRIYKFEPSGDKHLKLYRNDEAVPTNSATIVAGNLDAIGYSAGASVDYTISGLENGVPAGEASTAFLVQISTTSATGVPYQVSMASRPAWVTGFGARSGLIDPTNGANLTITVDSRGLAPGNYSLDVVLTTSGADIVNSPLSIPIEIEVSPALLQVNPGSLSFVYSNCQSPETLTSTSLPLTIGGTDGVRFTAVVTEVPNLVAAQEALTGDFWTGELNDANELALRDGWGNATSIQTRTTTGDVSAAAQESSAPDAADWLVVTPDFGTADATVNVTILPSALPTTTTSAEALLILVGDSTTGSTPDNVRFVPIHFLCASTDVYLPLIARE